MLEVLKCEWTRKYLFAINAVNVSAVGIVRYPEKFRYLIDAFRVIPMYLPNVIFESNCTCVKTERWRCRGYDSKCINNNKKYSKGVIDNFYTKKIFDIVYSMYPPPGCVQTINNDYKILYETVTLPQYNALNIHNCIDYKRGKNNVESIPRAEAYILLVKYERSIMHYIRGTHYVHYIIAIHVPVHISSLILMLKFYEMNIHVSLEAEGPIKGYKRVQIIQPYFDIRCCDCGLLFTPEYCECIIEYMYFPNDRHLINPIDLILYSKYARRPYDIWYNFQDTGYTYDYSFYGTRTDLMEKCGLICKDYIPLLQKINEVNGVQRTLQLN